MSSICRNMLITVEVDKNERSLISEIKSVFPDSDVFEVNSIDTDNMIQIVIPLVALIAPAVKDIVTKICDCKKATLKHNGTEISGDHKTVVALWNMLKEDSINDDNPTTD